MSLDLRLSPEHERLRQAVAAALASRPYEERAPAGPARAFASSVWARLAEIGALRMALPGTAEPTLAAVVVSEELGRALQLAPYGDTLLASDVLARADPEHPLLDAIATGSCRIAVAANDPAVGGRDVAQLVVERRGERYAAEGLAAFVGSALDATSLLLVGRDPSGSAAIALVPRERDGISVERRDDVGRANLTSHEIEIEGDASEIVLKGAAADDAWRDALARARVRQAAYLVGLAQGALDVTLRYTRTRHAFGRQISTFQALSFRLAAMAAQLDPVRLLVQATALRSDRAEDVARRAAQALALAGELALDVVTDALQLHGAYGLTEEAAIQRYYRRAPVEATRLGSPAKLLDEAAAALAEELTTPVAAPARLVQPVA